MSAMPVTVTYLTLLGKPGTHPIAEGTSVDHDGERFVVDQVMPLVNGGWQASAMPARIWYHFEHA